MRNLLLLFAFGYVEFASLFSLCMASCLLLFCYFSQTKGACTHPADVIVDPSSSPVFRKYQQPTTNHLLLASRRTWETQNLSFVALLLLSKTEGLPWQLPPSARRQFVHVPKSAQKEQQLPSFIRPTRAVSMKGSLRDFFPEDLHKRTHLFEKFKRVSRSHGFQEYEPSPLERPSLYGTALTRHDGTGKVYGVKDGGEREWVLRPEVTGSLGRMLNESKHVQIHLPVKWFSIAQCWRYERPAKGRRREHFQWNVDIWGVEGVEAEAELLSMATEAFAMLGLTHQDVVIRISHKKVFSKLLTLLGVPLEHVPEVARLVDRKEKMPRNLFMEALQQCRGGLTKTGVEQLIVLLEQCDDLPSFRRNCPDQEPDALRDLEQLWDLAATYGYERWLRLSLGTVRGLPYYTGIVFEAFDRKERLRSILGGGRYDGLLKTGCRRGASAAGFALGDVVLSEVLRSRRGLSGSDEHPPYRPVDLLVWPVGGAMQHHAVRVASRLRLHGWRTELCLGTMRAKAAFGRASALKASAVVIIGQKEWSHSKEPQLTVKWLRDGRQEKCAAESLADYLRSSFLRDSEPLRP